jgi:hypothetical protein
MTGTESEVSSMKAMIAEIKKDAVLMLLVVLSSALEEQRRQGTISRELAKWIYNCCKDAAIRRGYISTTLYDVTSVMQMRDKTYASIAVQTGTVEKLKELSSYNNDETYDQIILKLIKSYKKTIG